MTSQSWEKGRIRFQMPAPWKPYSAIRDRQAELIGES